MRLSNGAWDYLIGCTHGLLGYHLVTDPDSPIGIRVFFLVIFIAAVVGRLIYKPLSEKQRQEYREA
jgi:hypothetical protein